MCKAYTKALPVVQKEEGGRTPRFYVRCLAELDDFIKHVWDDKTGRYVGEVFGTRGWISIDGDLFWNLNDSHYFK